jgi:hypothetical protein
MPQRYNVAENLCSLAKDFKSGDPVQVAQLRRDFKDQSKNSIVRAVIYLMEVIGSRDEQFKQLTKDNKDLKEILELNGIKLGGEDAPSTEGSDGMAAEGVVESSGSGGPTDSGYTLQGTEGQPNVNS